jgi:DNA-binding transcriptional regulator YiaG
MAWLRQQPYHQRMAPTEAVDQAVSLARVRRWASSGHAQAIRSAAGLSQGELARLIGVEPATVSRWEAGKRCPRGEAALRYAEILEGLAS